MKNTIGAAKIVSDEGSVGKSTMCPISAIPISQTSLLESLVHFLLLILASMRRSFELQPSFCVNIRRMEPIFYKSFKLSKFLLHSWIGWKSKRNTFLASFLGGFFGADWFYLSSGDGLYIFAGLAKLFTVGGVGIW